MSAPAPVIALIAPRPRPLPPRRPARQAGFSLIELMVALVLLGLGILSLANVFPLGSRSQLRDRLRSSGMGLAQQKMEQLRTEAWSAPNLDVGVHPDANGEDLILTDEGTFNRRWIVESQPGAFADMKKVTVRVTWTYQRTDTVDLVTYFRR